MAPVTRRTNFNVKRMTDVQQRKGFNSENLDIDHLSAEKIEELNYNEIRKACSKRGLSPHGKRDALVSRLNGDQDDSHGYSKNTSAVWQTEPKTLFKEDAEPAPLEANLEGDYGNIFILLVLYTLQGIPMGLGAAVPLFLQQNGASMDEQALFKLVSWPYSIKLLWAPIVDCVYIASFGKRKSWIVPVQIITGVMMMFVGGVVKSYVEGGDTSSTSIYYLVGVFFMLYFMVATQDIAVDGWALTLLRKENIGYASTCNTVGQTAGYMTAYALFMALNSAEFCNSYLRWTPEAEGMVSFETFMRFWGIVFIVSTVLIWIFKAEKEDEEEEMSIRQAYSEIIGIMKLKNVQFLLLVLLTVRVGFAMTDAATDLQIVDLGVPKEHLALIGVAYFPLEILFPFLISRQISGPNSKPMSFFLQAYPIRIAMGVAFAVLIHVTPIASPGVKPGYQFYGVLAAIFILHRLSSNVMFVSQMAFFARVSDPRIGGTYMTLLNTLANLGNMWPAPFALKLLGKLQEKACTSTASQQVIKNMTCQGQAEVQKCFDSNGQCERLTDGYGILVLVCSVLGVAWYSFMNNRIKKLEISDESGWRDNPAGSDSKNDVLLKPTEV